MPDGTTPDLNRPHLDVLADRSPRILITRLSAIGDCILTMPLAVALRQAFPQAFIAWAVEGGAGTIVERHWAVDRAVRLPRRFARSPGILWRLRQQLRALRLDIVLDPQSLTKSALVGWISGAWRRIGFSRPVGREISPWLQTELVASRKRHVVDRYLELLPPLGIDVPRVCFDFPCDGEAEARMDQALRDLDLSGPFAVLNPGAGWPSKIWPYDRFSALAQELDRKWSIPSLVVWAGQQERNWAEQIVSAAGGARLAPATTLLELAAILRRATLFVGSDTGPLHMAAAVGTPCVGIYGPTRPEDCGPYGTGHRIVQARYQGGSSRQRRRGSNAAMREVSVAWVLEACEQVLALRRAGSAA